MSAFGEGYIEEFKKIAADIINIADEDRNAGLKRGLKSILAISAGAGVGTALGSGTAYLAHKYLPEGSKKFVLPAAIALGTMAGTGLTSLLNQRRDEYVDGEKKDLVLVRADSLSPEDYKKVKKELLLSVPKKSDKSVYLSNSGEEFHGATKEYIITHPEDVNRVSERLWGSK